MVELPEIILSRADGKPGTGSTKFGGAAEFIQGDYTPDCCGSRMTLLAQLDGLDYREADLPDSSLVYVFVCSHCFSVHAELQCM